MGETQKERSSEYRRFEHLVDTLLAVPRRVLEQRLKEHRERAAKNPVKRGPKRKTP